MRPRSLKPWSPLAPAARARALVLALSLALVPTGAHAAPAGAAEDPGQKVEALERKVEALEAEVQKLRIEAREGSASDARAVEADRKIEALTREIEKLRIGSGDAAEADASAGAGAEPGAATSSGARGGSRHGLGPAASKVYDRKRGVSIGGYGEILYQNVSGEREDGEPSDDKDRIDLLRGVLYTGYKFTDRVLFNSELEVEHATTGEGDEEKGEVSLEFAYLDFLWRPAVNVRAGLMLMPLGFLNELHEPTTFLTARRHEVETELLLSTWREAGVGAFGEHGMWSYRALLVNGLDAGGFEASSLREGRQGGSNALAEDFAFAGRLDVRPALGLLLGASVFTGNAAQGEEDLSVHTTIVDVHGELRHRGLELRALYARTSVGDAGELDERLGLEGHEGIGSRQSGGYLEAGFDVLSLVAGNRGHSLTPFLSYESLDNHHRVPAGFERDPALDRSTWTVGAAWKPIPQVVVKADYEDRSNQADAGVNQFNLALGYIF